MQAPSKSRTSAAAAQEVSPILVRMLIALAATVTLLFVSRPAMVHAQEPVKPVPAKAPAHAPAPAAHAPAPAAPAQVPAAHAPAPAAHTPAPAAPAPAATAAHPPTTPAQAAHALGTTTGSAQGALAEQTVGKSDAAPKEPAKAAPRAVRPAAARATANNAMKAAEPKADAHAPAHVTAPVVAAVAADMEEVNSDPLFNNASLGLAPARIWGPDGSAMRDARGNEPSTVFISHALDVRQADVEVEALLPAKKARARSGEYAGAPFAVAAASFLSAGFVGHVTPAPTGIMGRANAVVRRTEVTPKRVMLLDEIEITLPAGTSAEVGARFMTVDADRLVKSTVQIAVPTGVVEVVAAENGRPTIARVVQQTGRIEEGQRLLPLEGKAVANDLEVTSVPRAATGPETEVIWVDGDGLLPSLQSFLVLGAGENEGVKAGDQFALVTRRGLGPDATENRVAVVRVVRVTAFGSSAIVVRQDQPGIAVGGAARLIARAR